MPATVNGKAPAPKPYTKAYEEENPEVKAYLEEHLPRYYPGKTHTQASKEIHEYNSAFHNVTEREIARQLLEEGRILIEQIQSAGLPESFGELIDALTHLGALPGGVKVGTKKTPGGKTTPAHVTEQSASQKGEEELPGIGANILKYILFAVLLLGGAVLFVYGIMVAVRPRESAFSIPAPRVIPV